MGAYSRWAVIRGWALIRINTVITKLNIPRKLTVNQNYYKMKLNLNSFNLQVWHFKPPQENLCFLRGCLLFIKVRVSNILHIRTVYYNYHKSTNGHKLNRVNPEKKRNIVSLNSMITIKMKIKQSITKLSRAMSGSMETASIYKDTSKITFFKKICSLPLLQNRQLNSLYVDLHLKFPFQGIKELFLKLFCVQNE